MKETEKTTKHAPYIVKYEDKTGKIHYDTRLYVTDMAEVKKLAALGNAYAVEFLKNKETK